MSDQQGLSKFLLLFTALFGTILLLIGIFHGLAMLPTLIGLRFIAPNLADYAVFAGISWVVFYTAATFQIIAQNDIDELKNLVNSISGVFKIVFLLFAVVLVNSVVLASTILGFALISIAGLPTIGFIAMLLYPAFDLQYLTRLPTVGRIAVTAVLGAFHVIGVLQELTADSVVENFVQPAGH